MLVIRKAQMTEMARARFERELAARPPALPAAAPPGPGHSPAGTIQPCPSPPAVHWIEIELLGEDGSPIPGEQYRIVLPNGSVVMGQLDADGRAYVGNFADAGECEISFPSLDRDAWAPLAGSAAAPA